jgi:hypothetical protein
VKGHFTRLTLRYRDNGNRRIDRRGIARIGGLWGYYIVGHYPQRVAHATLRFGRLLARTGVGSLGWAAFENDPLSGNT